MKSKSRIERKAKRKTSLNAVGTIRQGKKLDSWRRVSDLMAMPRRKSLVLNLSEIDGLAKNGESVVVPGKVLSQGDISKKIRVIAMGFSKTAEEKLSKSKIEFSRIGDEIKKNPNAKDLRILEGRK